MAQVGYDGFFLSTKTGVVEYELLITNSRQTGIEKHQVSNKQFSIFPISTTGGFVFLNWLSSNYLEVHTIQVYQATV